MCCRYGASGENMNGRNQVLLDDRQEGEEETHAVRFVLADRAGAEQSAKNREEQFGFLCAGVHDLD
jgi:hypothetical protein